MRARDPPGRAARARRPRAAPRPVRQNLLHHGATRPLSDRRYRLILPVGACLRDVKRILIAEQPDILEVSDKYTLPFISGMLRKNLLPGIKRPTEIATSHERMDVNVPAHLIKGAPGLWFAHYYMRHLYFPM